MTQSDERVGYHPVFTITMVALAAIVVGTVLCLILLTAITISTADSLP